MQDILDWLDAQIDTNDPARGGMPAAVRLAEGAAVMSRPDRHGKMAFGLMLEPELFSHTAPLVERAKQKLAAYIETLGDDELDAIRDGAGSKLATLGLPLAAPEAAPVRHRITLRYPVEGRVVPYEGGGERERVMTGDERRCWDGVAPSGGFDQVTDNYCFDAFDWLVDARVVLRFDEGDLWCDVVLDCTEPPSAADLEALKGPVSRELWDSKWSLNLEWEDVDAMLNADISEDYFTLINVKEVPTRSTMTDLDEPER